MKLRIKYCGGCNPCIDRPQLVKEVINHLREITTVDIVPEKADIGLIVAGCSVCCVNESEIDKQALKWVVVAGTSINQVEVSASALPCKVCQAIIEQI